MAPSDELEYLKSLVAQLNDKIHALEERAKAAASAHKTPAQQLRTILIGPPGAGAFFFPYLSRGRTADGICTDSGVGRKGHAGAENTR